ncbi:MAG TPA: DUF3046 domain-containing protein [Sporichthyaceae bacterium]|jgi:hypothetical protein|nr:DUF3046 domain-containing protein [Sporichthyaceae bacterium]
MRLTEFWSRMNDQFGPGYAESFARDYVVAQLGGRTVEQALAAGVDVRTVWRAVCAAMELPEFPPEAPKARR